MKYRLENYNDTGSRIVFSNGVNQLSHEQLPAVDESRVGDPVLFCLVAAPRPCPDGKFYKTTNLRSRKSWTLPDAQHDCGGT